MSKTPLAVLFVSLLFLNSGDASLHRSALQVHWHNEIVWANSSAVQQVYAGMVNPSGLEFDFRVPFATHEQQQVRRIEVLIGDRLYVWTPERTEELKVRRKGSQWTLEGLRFRGKTASLRIVSSYELAPRSGIVMKLSPPKIDAAEMEISSTAELELREYRQQGPWVSLRGVTEVREEAHHGGQRVRGWIGHKDPALLLEAGSGSLPAVEQSRPWIQQVRPLR